MGALSNYNSALKSFSTKPFASVVPLSARATLDHHTTNSNNDIKKYLYDYVIFE